MNVQGDWKIDLQFNDKDNHFCYALPDHGHGPATIKLCMLDNWTDIRNEGQMIIRDLSNSNNDKSFRLMQKCNLDNPAIACTRGESTDESDTKNDNHYNIGNRSKAVGYGYNVTMAPGYDAVSTNPIIALEKLEAAGKRRQQAMKEFFETGMANIMAYV